MTLQKALVHIGAAETYRDAHVMLMSGKVALNRRPVNEFHTLLYGGHYFVKVNDVGLFKFVVRANKIRKLKWFDNEHKRWVILETVPERSDADV